MLTQFVFGWIMWAAVRGTYFRHAYSIFFGLFLQSYMYGHEVIYIFALSTLAYFAMLFLPRQKQ
jgi:MFS-type transporter involved in bile tolerance (Atg22 family)